MPRVADRDNGAAIAVTARTLLGRRLAASIGAVLLLAGCASTVAGRAAPDTAAVMTTSETSEPPAETDDSTTGPTETSTSESTAEATTAQTTSRTTRTETTSETTSEATDTAVTSTPSDSDVPALTPPGTQLGWGGSATLPISYAGEDGVFTFSNVRAEQGSTADWATLGVDDSEAQGEDPWFLRMTVKQESGGDFAFSSVEYDLWSYANDGDYVPTVYAVNYSNSLCPVTAAPADFSPGDSYDSCIVLAVNSGESLERVQYEGDLSLDDVYYDNPVVWSAH